MRDETIQLKRIYDLIAESFDRTRRRPWIECLKIIEGLERGALILDVGCGNGRHSNWLAREGFRIVGIDFSRRMIEVAMRNASKINVEVEYVVGDACNLPFKDNVFDGVLSIALIHHLPSEKLRVKAVEEVKRVLKPRGKALFSAWYKYQLKFLWKLVKTWLKGGEWGDVKVPWRYRGEKLERFYHLMSLRELRRTAEKAGLKVVEAFGSSPRKKRFWENVFVLAVKEQ